MMLPAPCFTVGTDTRGDERCWVCTRHCVFLDGQKAQF
jgi:hypothetical protein